ncbi:chromate transporter [Bhargavaea beijingensis]|uniref:Chromate transporter n=1 Tax=Bhargavaea beijingensis TaxID=426756 RepID=A0A1G6ZWL3_9BACL|nr:chromate transporter [Bhargavaea beijingensis]MCW1927204.1 chromate transporter [Bhargavaea beijingensis]RSK35663.1 chromate transporter [Bhargavaea beijingensis]SDE07068.1 chromate transporter [Bhargavaea beijingensis]
MYKDLFIAFSRAGLLGYGGGLSAIPLMHNEVVERYKWLDDDEFSDILALANTLPGPINTKLAGYIGWRLKGFWGMMVSLIGSFLPTAILMVLLLTLLNAFKDKPWVQGMAKGVIPIAGVMIGVMAIDFIKKAGNGLGWWVAGILAVLSIILIGFLGIHPAILIVVLILSAFVPFEKWKKRRKEGEK